AVLAAGVVVVELPEQGDVVRVGHVQGEGGLAAGAEGTHQHGVPGVVVVDVAHGQAAVDEPAVLGGGVVLAAQVLQVRDDGAGHEGELLRPGGAVEGVQHAVVGADVDLGTASLLGFDEVGVLLVAAIDGACQVGQVLGT